MISFMCFSLNVCAGCILGTSPYGEVFEVYVTNGKLFFDINERILRHYPSAAGMHEIVLRKVLLDN